MAFVNFYIQSGANSMNAGSTTSNAADVTQTNGAWSTVTNIFTAAAATPFSGVTANVDYASIYPDGTTSGAVYVALITAVGGGGLTITLSSTIKYGTAPTTGATGISAKVNGAWADHTPLGTLTGTVPQSTKINIKQATYTVAATTTIALAGAATTPLWIDGYNTTPGDLNTDTTNALAKPVLALNATFKWNPTGNHQIWGNLSITANRSGTTLDVGGQNQHFIRVRVQNTSSNSAAGAISNSGATQTVFAYCWAKLPSTATTASGGCYTIVTEATLIGCVAEGGGTAGFANSSSVAMTLIDCVALNTTGSGVLVTGAASILRCVGLTVYNPTIDGIRFSAVPTSAISIVGSLFALCGGFGINNAGGTNTNVPFRACNDFYLCTSGNENGFGDSPAFFGQTESVSPVTSSTDMTPVSTSNAISHGFPGIFENEIFSSFVAIGAVDPLGTGGSGGYAGGIFGA